MNRELVTDPLGAEDLWADLRTNIKLLKTAGYTEALVFFGFGWGKHIYEDQWQDLAMDLDAMEQRIVEAESKGFGSLGDDNLYFTIEALPIRLNYSYERDIHLSYSDENDIVSAIRERWLSQGWLTESQKSKYYNR
jgi:hypothetical protein